MCWINTNRPNVKNCQGGSLTNRAWILMRHHRCYFGFASTTKCFARLLRWPKGPVCVDILLLRLPVPLHSLERPKHSPNCFQASGGSKHPMGWFWGLPRSDGQNVEICVEKKNEFRCNKGGRFWGRSFWSVEFLGTTQPFGIREARFGEKKMIA